MVSFEGECEQLLLKIFRLFDSHSTSVIKTHVWSGNMYKDISFLLNKIFREN